MTYVPAANTIIHTALSTKKRFKLNEASPDSISEESIGVL